MKKILFYLMLAGAAFANDVPRIKAPLLDI